MQNVIVELQYQEPARAKESGPPTQRSVYAGWTGFESKRKKPAIVGRDAGRGSKEEIAVVEISTAFGRTLGLSDGHKVCGEKETILESSRLTSAFRSA